MTETVWLTKPKAVNTVWQFTEKIYQLIYIDLWVRKDLSFLRVTSEELIKAMDSFPQNDVEIHIPPYLLALYLFPKHPVITEALKCSRASNNPHHQLP